MENFNWLSWLLIILLIPSGISYMLIFKDYIKLLKNRTLLYYNYLPFMWYLIEAINLVSLFMFYFLIIFFIKNSDPTINSFLFSLFLTLLHSFMKHGFKELLTRATVEMSVYHVLYNNVFLNKNDFVCTYERVMHLFFYQAPTLEQFIDKLQIKDQ